MKTIIGILALALSTVAMADGFKCEQLSHDINIKIYNQTEASSGTRNAAVMVLSDATVTYGRKTIATFTSSKRTLDSTGTFYAATVDLRVSESNRAGENLFGTKLGHLKALNVIVAHNFAYPVAEGKRIQGSVTTIKRNGESKTYPLECVRYLKN